MPLGLHSDCIKRLVEFLADCLGHVGIKNAVYLDFDSTDCLQAADKILPMRGEVRERLNHIIGEDPLFAFLFETITRDIYENGQYDAECEDSRLTDTDGYSDAQQAAQRLINEFESLPWQYVVSFEIPITLGEKIRHAVGDYQLAPKIRLVAPDSNHAETYPLQSRIEQRDKGLASSMAAYMRDIPIDWVTNTAYLRFEAEGLITRYGSTTPVEKVINDIKAFFGLSLALLLTKIEHQSFASFFGRPFKSYLIVHQNIQGKWQALEKIELPYDLSVTLHNVTIINLVGKLSPAQINQWIHDVLALISKVFGNRNKSGHILLAAQWLLDSYVGTNKLLSFVQTMVAMEILLGEEAKSDEIGIRELIGNRCAYLIGKSLSERAEILEDFKNIYSVRSQIVHGGQSHLSNEERQLLGSLQVMCWKVIQREVDLLVAEEQAAT